MQNGLIGGKLRNKWLRFIGLLPGSGLLWLILTSAGFAQNFGIQVLTDPAALPYLPAGERIIQYSSHDRSGANNDGFDGTYSALFQEDGQSVLFDETGSGCIDRIWMTKLSETNRIRIFFDGESAPRIDMPLGTLFSGTNAFFPAPLTGDDLASSGGYYCYVPLAYTNGCRVTLSEKPFFYQITAHRLPSAETVQTWSPEQDLSGVLTLWTNCGVQPNPGAGRTTVTGSFAIAVGTTGTLFSTSGTGQITGLRLTPGADRDYCLTNVWLTLRWDGSDIPQAQVPLGDFFGCRFKTVNVHALMVGMQSNGSWYCYFPMPFWTRAEIQLENRGEQNTGPVDFEVEVSSEVYDQKSSGWFHAAFQHQRIDTSDGRDVLLLQTNGWGRIVGVNYGIRNNSRDPLGYLEGDERIYLDGSRTPQLYGTGTEDFFNGGWYFNQGSFTSPLHGNPARNHEWRADWGTPPYITNNFTSAYRFFLGDSIPFYSGVKFGMEHGYNNSQKGEYSSVVYFYRHPDRNGLLPVAEIDSTKSEWSYHASGGMMTTNTWKFEGDDDTVNLTFTGHAGLAWSQFTVPVCSTNAGLLLRRTMDSVPGRQRAAIAVNGVSSGTWYTPDCNFSNQTIRWADAEYLIPAKFTAGCSSVTVRVEYPAPDANEYRWQVFAIEPLSPGPDYDADGLPDAWETCYFTNIVYGVSAADTDSDGMNTLDEYIAGTDPQNAESALYLRYESGAVLFPSVSGRQYQLQFRTSLTTGDWQTVQSGMTGTSEQIFYNLPQDTSVHGYYRVRVNMP